MAINAVKLARKAHETLHREEARLERVDKYFHGEHDAPYMPRDADEEFRLLAERCITNWCPTLVSTPSNGLYVDNFRVVKDEDSAEEFKLVEDSPFWKHWEESQMDARQSLTHNAALTYGHAFVLTERDEKTGKIISKGLSTLRTVALYEDAATDIEPVAAVYFRRFPSEDEDDPDGIAYVWDETFKYTISLGSEWRIVKREEHGASMVPVTRFAAFMDLEGRTWGVIEPMIPVQNRINQTIFDLLMGQTYTSYQIRTATGMVPPFKQRKNDDGEWELVLDDNGHPVPDTTKISPARMVYSENADTKFGTLEGGDLDGFIAAAELAVRHLSALSKVPPHFLLGQIANVSAEALEAAETALMRLVEAFQTAFGVGWERVFRVFAQIAGESLDFEGEVIWRDMSVSSLAQAADALGKFSEALGIPSRGLWGRVPKVSKGELAYWERLRQEDDKEAQAYEKAIGPFQTDDEQTQGFGSSARSRAQPAEVASASNEPAAA